MTNTEFIHEIILELEKNQVKYSERELFELIVFPLSDEKWEKKYKANWSNWRWRKRVKAHHFKSEEELLKGNYTESLSKSPKILESISKRLNFDIDRGGILSFLVVKSFSLN